MRSNKASSRHIGQAEVQSSLEAVRISSELIAFYPHPVLHPQPYVILLNAANGIIKRLDLQEAK